MGTEKISLNYFHKFLMPLLVDSDAQVSQSQTPRGFLFKISARKTNTNKKHRNERKYCPKKKQQTNTQPPPPPQKSKEHKVDQG